MNTAPKSVAVLECTKCGKSFLQVGDTAIRLSQYRPPKGGTGTCPDHKKGSNG